jgi:phosphate-selective porin OprO and OprP
MSLKTYLYASLAASTALLTVAPAHAQSTAQLNAQIQSLQSQLKSLTQQLYDLQSQVVRTQRNQAVTQETVTQMKAATPAPAPAAAAAGTTGVVASMPNNRPTLSTADGQNTVSLVGRIHWDVGDYMNYHAENARSPGAGTATPANLNSGENVRRARIGIQGKILGDWNYALIYDFGGTNDMGSGGAVSTGGIENAEISYTGFRPLTIEGGIVDVPYTLDESISSNDIMFIERASSQVIAANLAAGDFRSNFGAHWNNDRIWLGAYFTGPTTGTSHAGIAQQIGAVQRATYQVFQNDLYNFHIGADFEELIKPSTSAGTRLLTTFSDRPELRIDTSTIVNTGTLGSLTNPVTGANVMGAELAGGYGPLYGQAEYFHYNVNRSGLSTASFDGGYIEGSYTITGEHRKYNPATGAYSGIVPDHPFSISHFAEGATGALELGARYSIIDLDSNYFPGAVLSPSTNAVSGGRQQVFTLGANWYVNSNIRFMLDYLHGIIGKHNGTAGVAGVPLGAGTGATFDAIALRTQVAW